MKLNYLTTGTDALFKQLGIRELRSDILLLHLWRYILDVKACNQLVDYPVILDPCETFEETVLIMDFYWKTVMGMENKTITSEVLTTSIKALEDQILKTQSGDRIEGTDDCPCPLCELRRQGANHPADPEGSMGKMFGELLQSALGNIGIQVGPAIRLEVREGETPEQAMHRHFQKN